MRPLRFIATFALLAGLGSGCATTTLVNQFDVPEGTGAILASGGDVGFFSGGAISEFVRYNGTDLNHGYFIAGKDAQYRIPADSTYVDVRVNYMESALGRVEYAHVAFIFEAEGGATYTLQTEVAEGGAHVSLVHSSRGVIAGPEFATWTTDRYAYSRSPGFQIDIVDGASPGRTARCEELIGYWRMLPVEDPSINEVNPWPLPHQWFAFYPEGRVVSMMRTEAANLSSKDLATIFEPLRNDAPRYHCDEPWLVIEHPDEEGRQLWGKNIFLRRAGVDNTEPFERGDIVLTLAAPDDRRMIYFRHLRRVQ